jgi:hypothetical protein
MDEVARGPQRAGADVVKWYRIVCKEVGPLRLQLELVVSDKQDGPGMWADQLAELLAAHDRVSVRVALVPTREGP